MHHVHQLHKLNEQVLEDLPVHLLVC
jgi:hypothetical protein